MKGRIWTVPNQITFLRLCILPFFLIFVSYEKYKWALLILVIAGLSDGIDGLIARKFNQGSSLGAYLDPLADKVFVLATVITLSAVGRFPWWATAVIVAREAAISVLRVVLGLRGRGGRPAPEEVAAGEIGDLVGGGEVHDGFRAFLGRDREHLRSPQGEREQSAAFSAEVAGDEAWMQAVDGNALAGPPAGKLAGG